MARMRVIQAKCQCHASKAFDSVLLRLNAHVWMSFSLKFAAWLDYFMRKVSRLIPTHVSSLNVKFPKKDISKWLDPIPSKRHCQVDSPKNATQTPLWIVDKETALTCTLCYVCFSWLTSLFGPYSSVSKRSDTSVNLFPQSLSRHFS